MWVKIVYESDLIQSRLEVYCAVVITLYLKKPTATAVLSSSIWFGSVAITSTSCTRKRRNAKHKFAMCHYTNVSVPFENDISNMRMKCKKPNDSPFVSCKMKAFHSLYVWDYENLIPCYRKFMVESLLTATLSLATSHRSGRCRHGTYHFRFLLKY